MHSTAITKLASQQNRQGHVNGAIVLFFIGTATLDNFPACRCRLFKRSNDWLCARRIAAGLFFGSTEMLLIFKKSFHTLLWSKRPEMSVEYDKKKKTDTADAIKILRKNGYDVTQNEAIIILDFLYFIAKLSVNQYVEDVSSANKKS